MMSTIPLARQSHARAREPCAARHLLGEGVGARGRTAGRPGASQPLYRCVCWQGLGLAAVIPSSQSLLADYYPGGRGKAFGWMYLTGAVGGMLGGFYVSAASSDDGQGGVGSRRPAAPRSRSLRWVMQGTNIGGLFFGSPWLPIPGNKWEGWRVAQHGEGLGAESWSSLSPLHPRAITTSACLVAVPAGRSRVSCDGRLRPFLRSRPSIPGGAGALQVPLHAALPVTPGGPFHAPCASLSIICVLH